MKYLYNLRRVNDIYNLRKVNWKAVFCCRNLLGSDWITLQNLKDLTLEPMGEHDVSHSSEK